MPTVKEILFQAQIRNPLTNRVVKTPKRLSKLVRQNLITPPQGILFNNFTNRFNKDTQRTRNRISNQQGVIIKQRRITKTLDKIRQEIREEFERRPEKHNVLLYNYNYGTGKYEDAITLNQRNQESFFNIREVEAGDSFSQAAVSIQITGARTSFMPVQGYENRPEGAFFPYTVPENFGTLLEKYGVYTYYDPKNYKNNCLINAFKVSQLFSRNEITTIKSFCRGGYIPKIALRKIAGILEIKIILRTYIKYPGKKEKQVYKTEYGSGHREISLGLINGHYFLNEPVKMTLYFVKNHLKMIQDDIMNKDNPETYIKTKGIYRRDSRYYSTSFKIIRELVNTNYLKKINEGAGDIIYNNIDNFQLPKAERINKANYRKIKKYEPKEYYKDFEVAFFDFESIPTKNHIPYVCDLYINGSHKTFEGFDCAKKFLSYIQNKPNVIYYAHNLRYDLSFLFHVPHFKVKDFIKTGNQFKQLKATFGKTELVFKDSLAMIPIPLSKFGKTFNLKQEKEVMPYKLFTKQRINQKYININTCLKYIEKEDKQQFKDNCKKLNMKSNVDIIEYAKWYCQRDTEVLSEGFQIFRNGFMETFNMDIKEYVSIPQLSNEYLNKQGCFKDVYQFAGYPRQYFQNCAKGGRVMMANNEKGIINKDLEDIDFTSLYPSAMSRIPGFEKGLPKPLKNKSIKNLKNYDNYYIRIKFNKVNKKLRFPVICKTNEKGIKNYVNEPCEEYYCSKIEFEDLIKFNGIDDIEIIDGYYFDEGFNNKINKTIQFLFEERKKYPKSNPMNNIIKLVLNSAYGKLLLKPIDNSYKCYYDDNEFKKALNYRYNEIKHIKYYPTFKMIKFFKPFNHHFNNANLASSILSMSKRYGNEYLDIAEKYTYYTDTDSFQTEKDKVDIIVNKFKKKYNRDILGKNLGQLHPDFVQVNGKHSWSTKLIMLGKKSYYNKLINEDGETQDNIRMKGIPGDCILKNKKMTPEEQYIKLFNGEKIKYDLLEHTCAFEMRDLDNVSTKLHMEREVQFNEDNDFNYDEGEILPNTLVI